MSFLFRLPLFHFNIEDPESLKRNWEHILKAIHLSSPIFYKELQEKSLEELDPKQQIKLRKYLLRGRYRPTPFGKFAGVGVGNWGTEIKLDFPLIQSEINPSTSSHSTLPNQIKLPDPILSPHRLIPGIITKHNHYHALIYDNSIHKWKGCKLPVNPLMEVIINQATEDSLSFHQFSQLLSTKGSGILQDQIEELWENILSSGFLVPCDTRENIKSGVDIIIKNKLNLPKTIKDQLEKFIHSSGNLFGKEESLYIRDFKKYFMEQFDDRQVLLSELLSDTNFLSGQFLKNTLEPEIEDKFSAILTDRDLKPIDLQKSFDKKEPEKDIYDIQVLFRLDMQGNPVIENIVCNRPFVYTGRFNRDPTVKAHTYEIKNRIFTDPEVIYTHVQLYESKPIQHISNVINVFDLEITPFQSSQSNQLSFEELYIGIWDDRILLLDKHSHKQVIPVILHPLNGEQITHPILRLLWEIAHQNRFRFLPYQSDSLSKLPYSPQLNWGEICLQNRKWKLEKSAFSSPQALQKHLQKLKVPTWVLAGYTDRELLLDLNKASDLKILWQELQRSKTLTLNDPVWHPSSHIQSQDGACAYPQFVYQISRKMQSQGSNWFFNPINKASKDCMYFIIKINHTDLPEVLTRLLNHMDESQVKNQFSTWFFLLYEKIGTLEIRLRILNIPEDDKKAVLSQFLEFFIQEELDWKTADYFPETSKYGTIGLKTSHQLFHLESKFSAQQSNGILQINHSAPYKEDLIVRLWRTVLLKSPFYTHIFNQLKEEVKNMPFEKVKAYKASFTFLQTFETMGFDSGQYLKLLGSHEYFSKEEKAQILLFNHLHMMINRFFPLTAVQNEPRIRYRLYREIGKYIYTHKISNKDSTPAPNPKRIKREHQ